MIHMSHSNQELADQQLVERWRDQPAPLLGLLHAFHDRDGYLSESAMRAIAKGLRQPLADLFGTITFYHHFAREAAGLNQPRVCNGPVCRLRGADACLAALAGQGAKPMPCDGRCDQPIPVLIGHTQCVGDATGQLARTPTPLPPINPGVITECVFAQIRQLGRNTLAGYRATGGYEGLTRAVAQMMPADVIAHVKASKLAGRGGEGFPSGEKWKGVADAAGGDETNVW